MVHTHNEILLSQKGMHLKKKKKKECIESVLMRCMNLEPATPSGVSQKEKTNIVC